jgi:hypothetical protein
LILALLPAGSWLIPRRTYYQARAREHEVLEGQYGGASWAIESPDFPPDAIKAAHYRRLRERYEYAARYPWLSQAIRISLNTVKCPSIRRSAKHQEPGPYFDA